MKTAKTGDLQYTKSAAKVKEAQRNCITSFPVCTERMYCLSDLHTVHTWQFSISFYFFAAQATHSKLGIGRLCKTLVLCAVVSIV